MLNTTSTINHALTHSKIELLAPSIFQSAPQGHLSKRYNFIPTIALVKEMEKLGWLPVRAVETKVRDEQNNGYQKHMVRFRNFDESVNRQLAVGDNFIEIVMTNSHNGLSSFIFSLGLFRLACSNGMVVSESYFDTVQIKHSSYDARNVIEYCGKIVDTAPQVINTVHQMEAIELSPQEQLTFANAAKILRFDNPQNVLKLSP